MDVKEITAKLKAKAAAADAVGSTVKFVFNGGEGSVFLDGNNANEISQEDKEADCTVEVDLADFNDMLTGDLDPTSAFMGGKMQIDGDMSVAMKLASLF